MHKRSRAHWVLTAMLLGAGVAAGVLAAVPFAAMRARVDRYAGDGSADPYTPALHGRLQFALAATGLLCIVLAVMVFRSRGASDRFGGFRREARDLRRRLRALRAHLGPGLIAVTLLAVVLRLPYIDQPMRFDEAYTYIHYASRPVVILLATYEDPNNHVLHSLLVHVVTRIVGESPAAIRLTAFAAGVLLAPAAMLLARAADGHTAAWFAGLLTAASSPLIEYSTNARGYTLLALLTVLCWLLAIVVVRRDNRLAWWLLAAALALGAWTIPVMLYPAAMLLVWIAVRGISATPPRRREILRGLRTTIAMGATLTLLMYAPILLVSGLKSLTGIRPLPWSQYLQGAGTSAADACQLLLRDIPRLSLLVLAIGFLFGAVSRRGAMATAVATVLICLVLTAIQRVLPPIRVWLFLIPLAAVVAGAGLAKMTTALQDRTWHIAFVVLVLLTVVWPAGTCLHNGSVLKSTETGVCPDARRIVESLAPMLKPDEPVISASPVSAPILYYADRAGVSREHFASLDSYESPIGSAVAVVGRVPEQSLEEIFSGLNAPADLKPGSFEPVAHFPSATVYRRSGTMTDRRNGDEP